MDIYCPICGEPWDTDCLHDEAEERHAHSTETYDRVYKQVRGDFQRQGCKALTTYGPLAPCKQSDRGALAGITYELLGDDIDGAASILADYMEG